MRALIRPAYSLNGLFHGRIKCAKTPSGSKRSFFSTRIKSCGDVAPAGDIALAKDRNLPPAAGIEPIQSGTRLLGIRYARVAPSSERRHTFNPPSRAGRRLVRCGAPQAKNVYGGLSSLVDSIDRKVNSLETRCRIDASHSDVATSNRLSQPHCPRSNGPVWAADKSTRACLHPVARPADLSVRDRHNYRMHG